MNKVFIEAHAANKSNTVNTVNTANTVTITDVTDFDPVHIFESGQCFRWTREPDGSYTGIVRDKILNVSYDRGSKELILRNTDQDDYRNIWHDYFDLGTDYADIKSRLSGIDDIMAEAVRFGEGMRILRQDFWEILISFILSSNNRIPRIASIIDNLSRHYGECISYSTDTDDVRKGEGAFYRFPSAGSLLNVRENDMMVCSRGGYRCRYIIEAAKAYQNGLPDVSALVGSTSDNARKALVSLSGVGAKVADCVLLYGGIRRDVFPVDLWIKRVMETLYLGRKKATVARIHEFAQSRFGDLAGYAQQYLFYYARQNKIGRDMII